MEAFLNAGMVMAVLFITVTLGYIARKTGLMDDTFDRSLTRVVIYITCPGLVLDSVLSNPNLPPNDVIWQVLGTSIILFVPVTIVALVLPSLYPIPEGQRSSHSFTITFSNVAFIGFAVCASILGEESLLYLSIYNLVCTLLIWTLGAWMISRSGEVKPTRSEQLAYVKKNTLTPTTIACLLAFVLALLHITDDGVIGYTCDLLGAMTPPATMLIIGSTLAKYQFKEMLNNVWAYVTSFVRLIGVPAIVYATGSLFISDTYVLAALTLISAMPAAQVGSMMGIAYGGDLLSLSQCMFITTVFSVITIPLVTVFVM